MKGELDPQTHLEAKRAKWLSMSASAKNNRNLEQFKHIYPRDLDRRNFKRLEEEIAIKKKKRNMKSSVWLMFNPQIQFNFVLD